MPRGERVLMSIFTDMPTRAQAFPTLRSSLSPRLRLSRFTVFGEWARLPSVLMLSGAHRARGERMESVVSPERAYWTDT